MKQKEVDVATSAKFHKLLQCKKKKKMSENDTVTSDSPWITLVLLLPGLRTAPLHKRKHGLKPDCLCVSAFT